MATITFEEDEDLVMEGCWYFCTISLNQDYTPSVRMIKFLEKCFSAVHAVIEKGDPENPKQHMHCVGRSTRRQDNIRNAIMALLKKDDVFIDDSFSVKIIPTPKPEYELGYIQKESDHTVVLSHNIADFVLKKGKDWYDSRPKRNRKEDRGTFNLNKFIDEARESCRDRHDIKAFLTYARDHGLITFSQYQKLNVKKMVEWILAEWDVN